MKKEKPRVTLFKDNLSNCARFNVSYREEKPKVKITFPPNIKKIKSPVWSVSILIAFLVFILIMLFGSAGMQIWLNSFNQSSYEYRIMQCKQIYDTDFIDNVCNQYANNDSSYIFLHKIGIYDRYDYTETIKNLEDGGLMLLCMFFLTILIRVVFGNHIKRNMGKIEFKFSKMLGEKYFIKTWKEVPECKYLEIPLFKNIRLDYKTTEDFSKYLIEVEIKELPFDYMVKKRNKFVKYHNDSLWYARFYFSEIPKSGKIEVMFQ